MCSSTDEHSGVLTPPQEQAAVRAEMLVRGFARVGIVALVDEATGYQAHRPADALQRVLEAYVAESARPALDGLPGGAYQAVLALEAAVDRDVLDVPRVGAKIDAIVSRGPALGTSEWAGFAGSVSVLLAISRSWAEFDRLLDIHHPAP